MAAASSSPAWVPPWRGERSRRSGNARHQQELRAVARSVQRLLRGFQELSSHRGCQPTQLGAALAELLRPADRPAAGDGRHHHGHGPRSPSRGCWHWANGHCGKGDRCGFAHLQSAPEATVADPLQTTVNELQTTANVASELRAEARDFVPARTQEPQYELEPTDEELQRPARDDTAKQDRRDETFDRGHFGSAPRDFQQRVTGRRPTPATSGKQSAPPPPPIVPSKTAQAHSTGTIVQVAFGGIKAHFPVTNMTTTDELYDAACDAFGVSEADREQLCFITEAFDAVEPDRCMHDLLQQGQCSFRLEHSDTGPPAESMHASAASSSMEGQGSDPAITSNWRPAKCRLATPLPSSRGSSVSSHARPLESDYDFDALERENTAGGSSSSQQLSAAGPSDAMNWKQMRAKL